MKLGIKIITKSFFLTISFQLMLTHNIAAQTSDASSIIIEQEKILNQNPKDVTAHIIKADNLEELNRYKEAIYHYNKALKYENKDSQLIMHIMTNKAISYYKLGKKNKSFKLLNRTIKKFPNSPYTHVNYGVQLCLEGKQKEGCSHIDKAIQLGAIDYNYFKEIHCPNN